MPYPKKQAIAIMLESRRRGDRKNERKAKASLAGKGRKKGGYK